MGRLVNFSRRVDEGDVRKNAGIDLIGQVRTEAQTDVKGTVKVELYRRSELMHGFAFQANEDGDGVSVLFDADALGKNAVDPATEAVLHVVDRGAETGALSEVNHADAVLPDHGFPGVIVE